jgi:hypothetical protein
MRSFNTIQTALVASDSKIAKWRFRVIDKNGVGYLFMTDSIDDTVAWQTGVSWDSGTQWNSVATSNIVLMAFDGINLSRNMAEQRIIAPSEMTFEISNPAGAMAFSDFKGGSVLVELFLSNTTYTDIEVASWRFRIKSASPGYQKIKIISEDFLQNYLRGYYPNTRAPEDIFSSTRTYDNDSLCVPVPFGTAYVPLRDIYAHHDPHNGGFILLGDVSNNYSITKIRSPRKLGTKCEWDSSSFSFNQTLIADSDLVHWRAFEAIIADGNSDGTADSHGFWMTSGGAFLDPLVQFTRSDTATMTNFADAIAFVLKDMGVPEAYIDEAVSFAAAHVIYDGWGLECNGAFWTKQTREEVLSQLLIQCYSCLRITDKIELHVLSKTSQKTITGADVLSNSFNYNDIVVEDYSNSGYVEWQESGEAQDELSRKTLVSTGSTASVISDEILECPFVQNSVHVQRIARLFYQRKFLKDAAPGFSTKGLCLALQPDDMITINDTNYGGSYDVLIDSVKINKDLSMQFSCSKFSLTIEDWGDSSPATVTVLTANDDSSSAWMQVTSGPDSTNATNSQNALLGRNRVGTGGDYILSDPSSPLRISLYHDDVEIFRAGNLNGFLGYVAEKWGLAVGAGNQYLKFDGDYFKLGPDTKLLGADAYNNDNVYIHSDFESLDGYVTGADTASCSVELITGSVCITAEGNNNAAWLYLSKNHSIETITFSNNSRFKTKIWLGVSGVGLDILNQTAYIMSGKSAIVGGGANKSAYGFCIKDTVIYGYASTLAGTLATTNIGTAVYETGVELEAVFTPGSKVEFYIDGILEGSITATLPSGLGEATFAFYNQVTTAGINKEMWFREIKFLQD